MKRIFILIPAVCVLFTVLSCSDTGGGPDQFAAERTALKNLLTGSDIDDETHFAIMNQLSGSYLAAHNYTELILFLTTWVETNPGDPYNAYWLLVAAHVYLQNDALPVAEYYFNRIIENYADLIVEGKSVHLICLENLIQINTSAEQQILYYTELLTRFYDDIDVSMIYFRMGRLYEQTGEWELAIKTYMQFLSSDNAFQVQVPGIPDAYDYAKKLIDFNNSSRDWTFETLDALEAAIKRAISNYDYRTLDSYRAKVNFFTMSWRQDAADVNSQANFTMRNFMLGNRIRYADKLDESSNPNEAYLRTWGWSQYVSVWYLYFRKVNFPLDPEIHGQWEWAGIYLGEKL
ncbi:MAG: tetratricopeptide repeat protein [Spirochaetaceae bacterium]|nr:tetratricopeptide repeat protein [Spirochaetaceae bacterium]